jgi:aryl-alcohol dehydrogenase-like predicted oxidoreductase
MERRRLGSTDLWVTPLALGTVELGMPYGLGLPAPPDDDTCIGFLRQAIDGGIGLLDTAAAYGRSEELIGRALAGSGPRPVIATKVSLRAAGGATPLTGSALVTHVEASVSRSLRLLGLDSLDLLQLHSAEEACVTDGLLALMDDLTRRGWVRYWGVSTYGQAAPLEALGYPGYFRALQVAYSLLDRRLDDRVLPACGRLGVGVIFRSVLLQGVLSDRWRQLPPHLAPLQTAAQAAAALAQQSGMTLAELAVRFALHHPHAHTVLFGSTSPAELAANLKAAAAGPLPADVVTAIQRIVVSDTDLLHPGNWSHRETTAQQT